MMMFEVTECGKTIPVVSFDCEYKYIANCYLKLSIKCDIPGLVI